MTSGVRLRSDIAAIPLVAGWEAWWSNLPPMPAALHARRHQVRLLDSFVRMPASHEKARMEHEGTGATYLDLAASMVEKVKEHQERYCRAIAPSLALADAYSAYLSRFLAEANGQSLEPLYASLPASLQGFVELVYDYQNRPHILLNEGLLFASEHYRPQLQSVKFATVTSDSDRRYFLAQLTLDDDSAPRARLPFSSPEVDAIFALDFGANRTTALQALEAVGLGADADALLEDGQPRFAPSYTGNDLRATYMGHACVLLERANVAVMVDPFVASGFYESGLPRFSFEQIPRRLDALMITHAHPDHFDIETMLRLRSRVDRVFVPAASGWLLGDVSLAAILRKIGFRDVVEFHSMDEQRIERGGESLTVTALPFLGEHGDVGHTNKATWLVKSGGESALFAADSAAIDPMMTERVGRIVGNVDRLFISTEEVGAPLTWTADALFPKDRDRRNENTRRCRAGNFENCVAYLDAFQPAEVYSYAMGLEPWLARIIGTPASDDDPRMIAAAQFLKFCSNQTRVARCLRGSEVLPQWTPR